MKSETKIWMEYSKENDESAKLLLSRGLLNACLQNVQQCVEKALKALIIENDCPIKKTHSIFDLKNELIKLGERVDILDEECDFLDSIYLPSKYPISSVLPDFYPDEDICMKAIGISEKVIISIEKKFEHI